MRPKKLHSVGMKRGAALPGLHRNVMLIDANFFEDRNGPMDLDLLELETQALRAVGIPPELLLGYDRTDFGHPIPGGGAA